MTASPPHRLGFGIVGRSPDEAAGLASLGTRLEALGYAELWANDGRRRSGLATVQAAAGSNGHLELGVGVVPLSERSAPEIAEEVKRVGIARERLLLGVGTGSGSSVAMVRDAVAELRRLLPGVRMAVAALGPKMCRLGGEVADVVLLNWAFPDRIAWCRERIGEGADAAGRPMPRVASYVRVAIGPDARARLVAEADRYRGRPRPYQRLFSEQDARDANVPGVAASTAADVPAGLAPYAEALDSCVVRALPIGDSAEELLAVAAAAAPLAAMDRLRA